MEIVMKKTVKCVSNATLAKWEKQITHKEVKAEIRQEIRRRSRKNKKS